MSEWVGIDDAPPPSVRPSTPARGRRPTRPGFRARRQQRIVLGAIDGGGELLRLHARTVLLGSAAFILPLTAVSVAVSVLAFDRFESFAGSVVSFPELTGGAEAATGVETVLAYLGIVCSALTAALVGGYVTAVVLRHARSDAVTIGPCVRETLRRTPSLLLAWVVGHSWVFAVAFVLTSTDGDGRVGLLMVLLPLGAIVTLLTLLVSPALMVERLGPFAALRRSVRLVRSRFSAALAFFAATVVLGGGLRLGIATLPRLAAETGLVTFGPYGWLVEGIAAQLALLITVPLVAVATAEFYLQLRMHAEGLDLVVAADAAFAGKG